MIANRAMKKTAVSLLCLGLVAACDAQADPAYQGEPLGTLRGAVVGTPTEGAGSPQVAVLWFGSTDQAECAGPEISCEAGAAFGPDTDAACVSACGPSPAEGPACDVDALEAYQACVEPCGAQFDYTNGWDLCANAGIGDEVPVTGEFPSMFKLDLFAPPPDAALLTSSTGGPTAALGWILVVDDDAPDTIDFDNPNPAWDETGIPGILGASEVYMLLYAADPIPADSGWGVLLGGAYEPGYHLASVVQGATHPLLASCTDPGCPTYSDPDTLQLAPADLDSVVDVTLASFFDIDFPLLD